MGLAQKAFKGGLWAGSTKVLTTFLQVVQYSLFARLLPANEIGLIALLMTVFVLGMGTMASGVSNGVIALGDISRNQNSSLFWLNLAIGVFIWLTLHALTPLICIMFQTQSLLVPLKYFTFIFLLIPWGQQFEYLLQKELNFKLISLVDVAAVLLEVIVCVALACKGMGIYSFIFGKMTYFAFRSTVFFGIGLRRWRPHFFFSLADIRPFIGFGLFQLGANYMFVAYSEIPKFVITPLLGLEAMGAYELASRITMQPLSKIAPILKKVAFPVIASVQNDMAKVRNAYNTYLLLLELSVAPISMLIGIFAQPLVLLFFGKEWLHIVPLVKILSIAVLIRIFCQVATAIALGMKRVDLDFYQLICSAVIGLVTIYPAARLWGVGGVAGAVLLTGVVRLMLCYFLVIKPLLGCTSLSKAACEYSMVLVLSVFVGLSVYFSGLFEWILLSAGYFLVYFLYRYRQIVELRKMVLG